MFKLFLTLALFISQTFAYDLLVTTSVSKLKIFETFEYTVEFQWTEDDKVKTVVFEDKVLSDDYEIVDFNDEQSQTFMEDGKIDFVKKRVYRLHPKKEGYLSFGVFRVTLTMQDDTVRELDGTETFVEVVDGVNYKKMLQQILFYVLVGVGIAFVIWILLLLFRIRSNKKTYLFENEMFQYYKNHMVGRFSNDRRKRVLVLLDFLDDFKQKAKVKKIDLFDNVFWTYIGDKDVRKMGDSELDEFIVEIEKKIVKN